jgi:glutamine amidotransferase
MDETQKKIIIVNYGMGNLRSVQKKFNRIGADAIITSDVEKIKNAWKLVLPGVGHFKKGVRNLKESGIWDVLNEVVLVKKTPILGICLGMQLMAKYSEEGDVEGLGWFDANVIKFRINNTLKYKVPHMGWNTIVAKRENALISGISSEAMFYFVHSYHIKCDTEEDILASTEYEYKFTSVIQKNNIYGTQFHPEKSHGYGEKILENFVSL